MPTASTKALIREMDAEELQEYADQLYTKCLGNVLRLSAADHKELDQCSNSYYALTGQSLKAKITEYELY